MVCVIVQYEITIKVWYFVSAMFIEDNVILWCRLLQLRFCMSFFNVDLICGRFLLTPRRRLLIRNFRGGKQ